MLSWSDMSYLPICASIILMPKETRMHMSDVLRVVDNYLKRIKYMKYLNIELNLGF